MAVADLTAHETLLGPRPPYTFARRTRRPHPRRAVAAVEPDIMKVTRLIPSVATPSMAAAIDHLHAACFPRPWSRAISQAFLDDEDVFGSVIAHDRALIGCILLRQTGEEAEILTVAVAPDHRRCGIAYKLMETGHRDAFNAASGVSPRSGP